jgi:hypothetical protein
MNAAIEDIKDMLEAESALGLTFATDLFLYREPAKPDNTVTLFEGPGIAPIGLLGSNEDTKHYERPSIQVRIRNREANVAVQLGYEIISVLHARAHEKWGSYYYELIAVIGTPYLMDWDENNRARVILNFNIQRRLV